ncbi:hypothetical protein BN2475_20016 [Paraburkholderia ribeironis]|uniref:Uncharacterized protein n=1 Tax=Paraburkholderia ribeironis TaxID=1247936 RepID=A0A1N7RIG4_9BURK|nr:hypothetical protein BN2475_20016 [Paraburkholderia ribeironis]
MSITEEKRAYAAMREPFSVLLVSFAGQFSKPLFPKSISKGPPESEPRVELRTEIEWAGRERVRKNEILLVRAKRFGYLTNAESKASARVGERPCSQPLIATCEMTDTPALCIDSETP